MGKKSQPKPEPRVLLLTLSSGVVSVLPQESMEDLEQLNDELNGEFDPDNPAEQFLVDQMVHARWKLIRVRRLESQAFANRVGDGNGSDSDILRALKVPGNIFDRLDRMAAAEDRAYSRAVRELAQLRARAQKAEKQNKANEAEQWLQTELAKLENEPILDPYIATGYLPSPPPVQNEPNLDPGTPPEPQP